MSLPRVSTILRATLVLVAVGGLAAVFVLPRVGPPPHVTAELDALEPALRAAIDEQVERVNARRGDDERHRELGMIYEAHGLEEDARIIYEDLARRRPDDARVLYRLSLVTEKQGDLDATIAALERSAALDPGYAPLHRRLGMLLLESGRVDEARSHLERATDLDVDDEGAWFGLARLAVLEGRPEDAVRIIDAHLEDGRYPVDAGRLKVTALRQLGRPEDAARLSERLGVVAVETKNWSDPWRDERGQWLRGSVARRLAAERLIVAGRFQDAARDLAPLVREAPDDEDLANLYAICLAETGRVAAARETLERAIEAAPDRVPPRLNLARLRAREGPAGRAAAIELVRSALALRDDHPDGRRLLAELLDATDDPGAADAWRAAWRADGRSLAPLERAAELYDARGRFDEAAAACRDLLRHEPAHGPASRRLVGILIDQGRARDAAAALARAVDAGAIAADAAGPYRRRIEALDADTEPEGA